MYLAGLFVLLVTATVDGWPGGAPVDACANMTPSPDTGNNGHGATPTTNDEFPYEMTFSKTCFAEGDTIDGKLRFSLFAILTELVDHFNECVHFRIDSKYQSDLLTPIAMKFYDYSFVSASRLLAE